MIFRYDESKLKRHSRAAADLHNATRGRQDKGGNVGHTSDDAATGRSISSKTQPVQPNDHWVH